ncbi:MAG TPA: universal stress protein [Dongiaceae bacterium]|jgi:nucleotide-binding universal stress UspA family protein|nr:universal stress protein [Dongiaceae bacterium]
MFKRILVPIDGSEHSTKAADNIRVTMTTP